MKKLFGYVLIGLVLVSLVLPGCAPKTTKVVIATDATWPPFEYIDEETKEIVGFDIDVMTAVAEKAGIEIEFKNVAWDPLLAGMALCQYDVAISAMTITEERKKQWLFSDPYFEAGQIITVLIDETEITDKDATLKTYDDIGLAFQDLMNGQIDAIMADNPMALGYVNEYPDKLKTVGEVLTEESYGIAVCKDNPDLLEKINEGLRAVKAEGLIEELAEKWL
jgi:polar amino acid transport system substrate-binding protein